MPGKVNRDWFYKLASDVQEERVSAAVSLIEELAALKLPEFDEEWSYVLRRLISGLASSRNGARLGFTLCLSEVVKMALDKGNSAPQSLSTPEQYLQLLSDGLSLESAAGNNKKDLRGKDERGALFGKMFGLQALLNEPLFSTIFLASDKKVTSFALTFADEVAQLAVKKNWLRESCLYTLFQTVQKLLPSLDNEMVMSLLSLFDKYQLTLTNEGLAIYLLLFHVDNENGKKFHVPTPLALRSHGWKGNDPLAKGNIPLLSRVLCDAPNNDAFIEDDSHPKAANWVARLHFVWDILIPLLTQEKTDNDIIVKKGNSSKKKKRKHTVEKIEFPEFWQAVVDETFFSDKASSERKYSGFLIFIKTIYMVPISGVEYCFTQNFMRCLINQSSDSKRMLNKISRKALEAIVDSCEKDASGKLAYLLNAVLFGPHGSVNFDKLTKSKTVSTILATKNLTSKGLQRLISLLSSQLDKMQKSDRQQCQFILDTILHTVRNHRSIITQAVFLHPLLDSIVDLAFFSADEEAISNLARERLFSILSELSVQNNEQSWQYFIIKMVLSKESSGKILTNKLDEDLKAIESEALGILHNVSAENGNLQYRGLECLLSNCILQLYSGDSESVSLIEELCAFYRDGLNQPNSLTGITEILLSLLAQKKALLKKLSLLVWEKFVSEIGEPELKMLLDVLEVRENKDGFAKLFENVDEFQEELKVDENEKEETEEKENKDDEAESKRMGAVSDDDISEEIGDESSDPYDSSDESDDNDNSNVASIDREATSALAKALNLPENIVNDKGEIDIEKLEGNNSDNSAIENEYDDDDEEEESMDDEQMMELDEQLSQIFKRRKEALSSASKGNERKLEVKESRENVIAFKHRIVDMLEIYVKYVDKLALKEDGSESDACLLKSSVKNLLLFVQPILNCVKTTLDKPLADRVVKLLKGRLYKVKISAFHNIADPSYIFELLEATHRALLNSKVGQYPALYFSICSTTSLFLGKILIENSEGDATASYDKLIDLYANTSKQWMMNGKFGPHVFIDFQNWLFSKKKALKE
ncbi:POL5 (YEL055C) [Zygosaccharomyces parabailii]|nr:POL5 (YEL055C) [Zygosaccharomyces parabailii]